MSALNISLNLHDQINEQSKDRNERIAEMNLKVNLLQGKINEMVEREKQMNSLFQYFRVPLPPQNEERNSEINQSILDLNQLLENTRQQIKFWEDASREIECTYRKTIADCEDLSKNGIKNLTLYTVNVYELERSFSKEVGLDIDNGTRTITLEAVIEKLIPLTVNIFVQYIAVMFGNVKIAPEKTAVLQGIVVEVRKNRNAIGEIIRKFDAVPDSTIQPDWISDLHNQIIGCENVLLAFVNQVRLSSI